LTSDKSIELDGLIKWHIAIRIAPLNRHP